jgi:hypothetical protein
VVLLAPSLPSPLSLCTLPLCPLYCSAFCSCAHCPGESIEPFLSVTLAVLLIVNHKAVDLLPSVARFQLALRLLGAFLRLFA